MCHSEQLDALAAALVAVQAEVPAIPKDASNPFFKSRYADLPTVVERASPILAKHGLSVTQSLGYSHGQDTLTTMVLHTSGQWVTDTMRLYLSKADSQGHGSAVTYARRYAYMAALGLVADEDDDGNAASRRQPTGSVQRPGNGAPAVTASPPRPTEPTATAKQRGLLNAKAAEKGITPTAFANILLTVAGKPLLAADTSNDEAQAFVNRQLERLPARLVDPVLTGIAEVEDLPF